MFAEKAGAKRPFSCKPKPQSFQSLERRVLEDENTQEHKKNGEKER